MESLYLIKCLRIIDHQQVEVHVVHVVCFLKKECFVVFIGLKELEILMFVINGEQDILKDNGTYNFK
tara:strand:+ start:207 stop:407 length:201 start_codon:yes stop_codon:yes gene_type:complete